MLVGLIGCLQSTGEPIPVSGDPGHSRSSSGGAGSNKSSSSGSGSATASTSGGGSTESSSSASSSASSSSSGGTVGLDAGINCPDLYVETRFFDALTFDPVVGGNVEALDANGVVVSGSATLTDSNGIAVVCMPHGQLLTLSMIATGYAPTLLENMILSTSWVFGIGPTSDGGDGTGLAVLSASALSALSAFLATPLDLSKPGVVVSALPATPSSACKHQKAGWEISVTAADGGAIPDGGYIQIYLGANELPAVGATMTSTSGLSIIYNIDLSITSMLVTAVDTNADAGECHALNAGLGLTGQVITQNGELTYAPIVMP
jgi:hypothetical protein